MFEGLSSALSGIRSAVSSAAAARPASDISSYMAAVNSAAAATNAFNASEAEKNRQWQEYMSNTSHRREMADLEAAGLNPILAARQGASTPSGSSASGADASGAIAGLLGQVISTQSAQAVANRNNATAQLIEQMRESHDTFIHQNYPTSPYILAGSLLNSPFVQNLSNAASRNTSVAKGIDLFFNPWRALPGWDKAMNALSDWSKKHISWNK